MWMHDATGCPVLANELDSNIPSVAKYNIHIYIYIYTIVIYLENFSRHANESEE